MQLESILAAVVVGLTAVCTSLVTAGATLGATVLLMRHQSQTQVRERKRERLGDRFGEVRRWVVRILRAADTLCDAVEILDGESISASDLRMTAEEAQECLDAWDYSPVAGSAKVVFVFDSELRRLLEEFDDLLGRHGEAGSQYLKHHRGSRDVIEEMRGDLVQLADKISRRMDQLLDSI